MANTRGLVIAVVAGVLGLGAALGLWRMTSRGPTLAPDFSVTTLDGAAVRLSAYRGRVVLVNLWTTWCPPCREEMPSMERLYQQYRERGFELLAVSEDEGGSEPVRQFVADMRLSFPVLHDPERLVGQRYGVTGYPESFLVDREGKLVEKVIGPRDWMAAPQRAIVERALTARPAELAPGQAAE